MPSISNIVGFPHCLPQLECDQIIDTILLNNLIDKVTNRLAHGTPVMHLSTLMEWGQDNFPVPIIGFRLGEGTQKWKAGSGNYTLPLTVTHEFDYFWPYTKFLLITEFSLSGAGQNQNGFINFEIGERHKGNVFQRQVMARYNFADPNPPANSINVGPGHQIRIAEGTIDPLLMPNVGEAAWGYFYATLEYPFHAALGTDEDQNKDVLSFEHPALQKIIAVDGLLSATLIFHR